MTVNYRDTYSIEDIKAKKLCFSAAMVLFTPVTVISATNAPMSRPITLAEIGEDMLFDRHMHSTLFVFGRGHTRCPFEFTAEVTYIRVARLKCGFRN